MNFVIMISSENGLNSKKIATKQTGLEDCLSKYIVNAPDDLSAENCGKCYNCSGRGVFPEVEYPGSSEVNYVQKYLDSKFIEIVLLKRWLGPNVGLDDLRAISFKNDSGLTPAQYGGSGFDEMVAHDKYRADSYLAR